MKNLEWISDNRIKIDPPKSTKKITGTRFAAILNLNPWSTPFEIWCAVTKTYEKPFEDTIYTIAGKTIEPKQAEYMEQSYGMDIIRPSDYWGKDYFNKTRGDFFSDVKVFGGMWDYLARDEDGEVDTILEMKTTKRIEDWANDIPEYYALQAALYAYLYGVDNVVMVASFLEDEDYEHPENFVPSVNNTITKEFKVSERYPDFPEMLTAVNEWWNEYVITGISPAYDEKRDAEILAALRTNSLNPDTDIKALIAEAEGLKTEIDTAKAAIDKQEKRLKKITDMLKAYGKEQFRDGDTKVLLSGSKYCWELSKSDTTKTIYNDEALKADGVYDKYVTVKPDESYTMRVKIIKEDK